MILNKVKEKFLTVGFFLVFIIVWQMFTQLMASILIPSPLKTLVAIFELIVEVETWRAFWLSNQALAIGFLLSLVVGITLGLIIGRIKWMEKALNPWLTFLLVLPMSMLMPIIIMAFGFSLISRVVIVFLFAVPTVIVNTRAGIREVPLELIEMGRVYGAKEFSLWRYILIKSAAPAIWVGFRIGLGRSITGMMLGELLLVAVGIGMLFKTFQGEFDPDKTFGLVGLLIAESLLLLKLCRLLEQKSIPWFYAKSN